MHACQFLIWGKFAQSCHPGGKIERENARLRLPVAGYGCGYKADNRFQIWGRGLTIAFKKNT
jgi:hypothetical protein